MKKKCSKCGIEKDISEFNKDQCKKDDLRSECKICKRLYDKKYYYTTKEGRLKKLLKSSKDSAKRKKIKHNLDYDYLLNLYNEQEGKCAITGTRFIFEIKDNNPHLMSIDRIEPSGGYVKGNVRFVTWQINCALHSWPDKVFEEMVEEYNKYVATKNNHDTLEK